MTQDISTDVPGSPSTKDAARDQAGQVAQHAKGEAGEVSGHAKQEAGQVVEQAKQEASHVAEEAKAQARNLYDDARGQLRQQASASNERAAGGVQQLASSLRALSTGDTEAAGPLGEYAGELGQRLDQLGQRMQDLGYEGVLDEVKGYARRRPGAFLLGAAAAGLVVGRLVRGERDRQQPSATGERHRPSSTLGTAPALPDVIDEPGVLQPAPGGGVMAPPTASSPSRAFDATPAAMGPDDVEHVHDESVIAPQRGL